MQLQTCSYSFALGINILIFKSKCIVPDRGKLLRCASSTRLIVVMTPVPCVRQAPIISRPSEFFAASN